MIGDNGLNRGEPLDRDRSGGRNAHLGQERSPTGTGRIYDTSRLHASLWHVDRLLTGKQAAFRHSALLLQQERFARFLKFPVTHHPEWGPPWGSNPLMRTLRRASPSSRGWLGMPSPAAAAARSAVRSPGHCSTIELPAPPGGEDRQVPRRLRWRSNAATLGCTCWWSTA